MHKSLVDGMFPVRWVDGLGYGYGYPIFNFYAPLPYYFGALFMLLGFGALTSTKLMLGFGILLSSLTMFFLVRKNLGTNSGIVSSVIYAYLPYHAVNIYVRGAVGELFAYAFLPIIFIGLFNLINIKYVKNLFFREINTIVTISFGIFLVALSHNLTLLMLFILLPIFIFVGIFFAKSKKAFFLILFSSIVIGIGLSSFYILPAILEMHFTNVASQVGGGADFPDHFVCLQQFWNSPWGFGGSVAGCLDGLSFKLGKLNILLSIFAFLFTAYVAKRKKVSSIPIVIFSICLLFASLFFTLDYSKLIWEMIPGMNFIQYPWRFINFIGLSLSILAGSTIYFIRTKSAIFQIALVILIIVTTIVTNQKLFQPQKYNYFNDLYYQNEKYVKFTVSKISDEYLPASFVVPLAFSELPESKAVLKDSSGSIFVLEDRPSLLRFDYKSDSNGIIHVNKSYFPAWEARDRGKVVSIESSKNGINIPVSKGQGQIVLRFVQTPIENLGNFITIIAFTILFVGIIVRRIKLKD